MFCVFNKFSQHIACTSVVLISISTISSLSGHAQTIELPGILVDAEAIPDDLQGRPASTTTISGDEAERRGVRTARDLGRLLPNVTGFDGGGNRMTNFTVRGVREFGYQSTPDVVPRLSYYVDDIPALTTLARVSAFRNLDSITLLRGPQASGYGFNRPGGVIDIRTARPSDRFTAWGAAGFGNFNQREFALGFSTPLIVDGLSLTGDFIFEEREGFYDNTALGTPYGNKQSHGGRLKGQYAFGSTSIEVILQHERFDDESDPFVPFLNLGTVPFEVAYNDPGFERIGQDLQALKIENAFENFDVLSVTSHRRSTWNFRSDGDLTAAPFNPMNPFARLIGVTDEELRTITQEFRFKSNDEDARLKWSAGAFYAHTDMDFVAGFTAFPNTQLGCCPLRFAETTNNDVAVHGELNYEIAPGIRVLPGIRYEWAKREGSNRHPVPNIQSMSDTFSAILPSIAVAFEPTAESSIYARYIRGFSPGGFVADRAITNIDEIRFDRETSNNFELGFKATLVPGTFALNGSLFYSSFDNYQVHNQLSITEFGVNNAQEVTSYGGELEAEFRFADGWRAHAGLGATRAKYDRFVNGFGNFSGNKVPFVPLFTANYGLAYEAPWGGYFSADARTVGEYFLNDRNSTRQDPFTLVDATLGFRTENFDIAVYGKNIFDKQYVVNVYDFQSTGGGFGNLGDPATYGVRAKVKF